MIAEDQSKYTSAFVLDAMQADGFQLYDQTTAAVANPYNFSFTFTSKIEALPIDYLTFNGQNLTSSLACMPSQETLNCLESKGSFAYNNDATSDKLDFALGYGIDSDSTCFQSANVFPKTFLYSLNILCKKNVLHFTATEADLIILQ